MGACGRWCELRQDLLDKLGGVAVKVLQICGSTPSMLYRLLKIHHKFEAQNLDRTIKVCLGRMSINAASAAGCVQSQSCKGL